MCGIIGASKGSEEAVRASLAGFAYRGPDAQKYFSDTDIALGHARLSIIDLDARSTQPFFDDRKEIGIVYNGEIYNFQELRRQLETEEKIVFRTTSDTEVLVYGYRVWGRELFPRLRGMFALAIYDHRDHSILLSRDHAGIKPLYYSLSGDRLHFASELKGVVSLLRTAHLPVSMDMAALELYPVLGYIPSPYTLVEEVQKLPRGTWLRYDLHTATIEEGVWKPRTQSLESRQDLEEAIRESVLEHCIADVPVGTFFSGGVDSSLITALLHEAGKNLGTFSIKVAGRPEDEPYFRAIAKELGVTTDVAEFGLADFESLYDDVLDRIDDPIIDTSIFPTAFVARRAAREVKVVLSGEGGDELFLGYPRITALARMRKRPPSPVFSSTFLGTPSFQGKNRLFTKFTATLSLPSEYYLLNTSPSRDLSSRAGWNRAVQMLSSTEPIWLDRDWYLENMLLRKIDMATSYASIEGRVPLLGARLWNTAPEFVNENLKNGKTILKDMLAQYIPRELIDRPKAGFGLDIATLFTQSSRLSDDLRIAMQTLNSLGVVVTPGDATGISRRYPVYGFGLVVLARALQNLGLA